MPTSATTTSTTEDSDASPAQAEALWKTFFEQNKITGGKTDGDGSCALRLNGRRVVVFCQGEDGLLVVQVHVSPMPKAANLRAPFGEALLVQALDVIEGDVLGIDPVEDTAVYQRTLSLKGLDAGQLTDALWDMVDAVDELQPLLPKVV
jgi:hypothetical protein